MNAQSVFGTLELQISPSFLSFLQQHPPDFLFTARGVSSIITSLCFPFKVVTPEAFPDRRCSISSSTIVHGVVLEVQIKCI